jgi:hypothetical protein
MLGALDDPFQITIHLGTSSRFLRCMYAPDVRVCVRTKKNLRSLHYAPPDLLSKLVALAMFMRLSLRKAAYVAVASAAR